MLKAKRLQCIPTLLRSTLVLLAVLSIAAAAGTTPGVDGDPYHPKANWNARRPVQAEEACCDPSDEPDCGADFDEGEFPDCCFGGYWACTIAHRTYCNTGDPTDDPLYGPVCPTTGSPTITPAPTTSEPTGSPTITPAPSTSEPPTTTPGPPCQICGDGFVVTDPDAIFMIPGQPGFPCDVLENDGLSGRIPLDQCPFFANIIFDLCKCMPGPPTPAPVTQAPVPTLAPTLEPTPAPVAPTPAPVIPPTLAPVITPTPAPVPPPTLAPVIPTTPAPVAPPTLSGPNIPCPDVPAGGCSVCGDGMCVTVPDAFFEFPGQPTTPCGILERSGYGGFIPLEQCPFFPRLIASCGCSSSIPDAPTLAPVIPTTPAPVVPPTLRGPSIPCPDVPAGGCSVCGDGMCVTVPDAIFKFPRQPATPCGILERAGYDGLIPLDQCPFIPGFIASRPCGCSSSIPGAPITVAPVTAAPVISPTPVSFPTTSAPVNDPIVATMAPISSPPVSPPEKDPMRKSTKNSDDGGMGMGMSKGGGMSMSDSMGSIGSEPSSAPSPAQRWRR